MSEQKFEPILPNRLELFANFITFSQMQTQNFVLALLVNEIPGLGHQKQCQILLLNVWFHQKNTRKVVVLHKSSFECGLVNHNLDCTT